MARRYYSSTAARTTLAADITNVATTVGVTAVSGWPESYPYTIIIDQDTINEEVVTVTALVGTTLTVTRGVDGTTGVAHSAGAAVNHGVSARDFDEPNAHVNTDVKHVLVVTSGTRPGSPSEGQIIYETDTDSFFGWNGAEWAAMAKETGAWTAYTPTLTNMTLGNGSMSARYVQIGKTVHLQIVATFGSTTSISGTVSFSLPINYVNIGLPTVNSVFSDHGLTWYYGFGIMDATKVYPQSFETDGSKLDVTATSPFTWTTNDGLFISTTYEAA